MRDYPIVAKDKQAFVNERNSEGSHAKAFCVVLRSVSHSFTYRVFSIAEEWSERLRGTWIKIRGSVQWNHKPGHGVECDY